MNTVPPRNRTEHNKPILRLGKSTQKPFSHIKSPGKKTEKNHHSVKQKTRVYILLLNEQ